ncbi:MAG: MFS transporter, partial [Dehalococcoidales bacterium]|nr:MFS transporter [Dehalococcoidales bacterium]
MFAGAFVSRLISLYYLSLMLEPHPNMSETQPRQSMWQISRSVFSTNIGHFILFTVLLNMAVNIGSPFFSVYALRELKISYISYQIINAASAVMTMLIVTWWGKHADKAGNVKILRICAWMIPFIPILWLVNDTVAWMSVVMLFSGFVWAGFNLCAGLFIYDAAPQENRTRYIALFGALGAIGSTLGSLIGGNLGPHLWKINGSFYLTLFLLSGLTRLLMVIFFFRRIEEVRDVVPVKALEMLLGGLRPKNLASWWQTTYQRARRQRRQR